MRDRPAPISSVLQASGLTKSYGETLALANVDLSLGLNRIVGLVGENGAGKSTLLNLLSGITTANSGSLEVRGITQSFHSYAEARRLGIARVFQEQSLISNIPVFENLLLGCETQFTKFGQLLRRREMIRRAEEMVEQTGARIDVRRVTSELSFSARQMVEIIRACIAPTALFGVESPIVLLDEPTASLDKRDEKIFFDILSKVKLRGTVLLVSHRLSEILSVCDEIVVLKDGRNVGNVEPADADERKLHRMMVGRERHTDYYHESEQRNVDSAAVTFSVRGLGRSGAYEDVTLEVKEGEILGIGGLLESGKSELGKGLAGIERPDRGTVKISDGVWGAPNIQRLIAQGLGYVPAERLTEGMIAGQPVTWNISLASGGDLFSTRFGLWRHRLEKEVSANLIARLGIKLASAAAPCTRLSGGNQQKVVLARWLARQLRVLILDNPTRGVDAGAKEEIYGFLRELTRGGVAIVLITDELLELIGLSNRISIMRHGRVCTTIDSPPHAKPTEQVLVANMLSDDASDNIERAA
jgi:ribose transport system ATP-binding protein